MVINALNKKGAVDPLSWVLAIGLVILVVFAGSGIIKFLISDKTPFIIAGVFIFLIMLRRRRD
jgi:hypothetical protein